MRIPSGLDDGNLYRRSNQKSVNQATYRRLFRLVLGLILVLVLMKQAGNPRAYRVLFSEPPRRVVLPSVTNPELRTQDTDSDEAADSPLDGEAAQAARERAQREAEYEQAQIATMSDGAIWKPQDQWVFYRVLEGTPLASLAGKPPRQVGVISLLQQPDVYLRTAIAMSGNVARVTRQTAQENDFGIRSYWELWLQPLDGSNRPVAFYTRELPPELRPWAGNEFISAGPIVDVQGVYLKRLAYQSAAGSELAPALVGHIHAIESDSLGSLADGTERARAASNDQHPGAATPAAAQRDSNPNQPGLGYMVLIAAVLGIGIAMLITLATAVSARKRRAARLASQHVSDQLLASLATNPEPHEQT
ncbi:MAG: hypothetical protein ACO1RT_03765 [Planctomycetaceae bacterium]